MVPLVSLHRMNKSCVEHLRTPNTHTFYFHSSSNKKKSINCTNAIDLFQFLACVCRNQCCKHFTHSIRSNARRHKTKRKKTIRTRHGIYFSMVETHLINRTLPWITSPSIWFFFLAILLSAFANLQHERKTCVVCMQANIELVIEYCMYCLGERVERRKRARTYALTTSICVYWGRMLFVGIVRTEHASVQCASIRQSDGAKAITWCDAENEWTITLHKSLCLHQLWRGNGVGDWGEQATRPNAPARRNKTNRRFFFSSKN